MVSELDLQSQTDQALVEGASARPLTEKDAVEIWIARWLRVPVRTLAARFGGDSRRLYDIWWGVRFANSRQLAADEFRRRYPERADRTVFGYRRIARTVHSGRNTQPDLFT